MWLFCCTWNTHFTRGKNVCDWYCLVYRLRAYDTISLFVVTFEQRNAALWICPQHFFSLLVSERVEGGRFVLLKRSSKRFNLPERPNKQIGWNWWWHGRPLKKSKALLFVWSAWICIQSTRRAVIMKTCELQTRSFECDDLGMAPKPLEEQPFEAFSL